MEANKAGIEAIKAGIVRVTEVVDSVAKIMEDGKVNIMDIREMPGLIMDLADLAKLVKQMPAEAKDLDNAELKEVLEMGLNLIVHIAEKVGVAVK